MSEETTNTHSEHNHNHVAEIKDKNSISPIWIIPLIALIVGGWMLYQHQQSQGQTVFIKMANGDGVEVGKTQIKVRSVKIGVVRKIHLAEDQSHVSVELQVENNYAHLLKSDSKVWVVKPRIDEKGISGLGTLLSGIYFEFSPGKSDELSEYFELIDTPPLIDKNIRGGRYTLIDEGAEVLEAGSPIYYRDYKVGQIESAFFDWKSQRMKYQLFVQAPYDNLVVDNSIFWLSSGIEFDLSADGINFRTGSLAKILKGGVSFSTPEREPLGERVDDGANFKLFKNYKTALEQRYTDYEYFVINFEESIRGLSPGAPVEYRGIRIGTVVEAPALLDGTGVPVYFSMESTAVSVLVRVEFGRIYKNEQASREFWESHLQGWLRQGLRASLKPGNLLTGAVFIDLDIYPDAPTASLTELGGYKVFPSTSSGFGLLSSQVSQILKKVNNLPVEDSLAQLNNTLAEFSTLAKQLQEFSGNPELQKLPSDMQQTVTELQTTLRGFQAGSPVYRELQDSLNALEKLLVDLQPFSKSLNETPSILLFDKKVAEDIVPGSEK